MMTNMKLVYVNIPLQEFVTSGLSRICHQADEDRRSGRKSSLTLIKLKEKTIREVHVIRLLCTHALHTVADCNSQ